MNDTIREELAKALGELQEKVDIDRLTGREDELGALSFKAHRRMFERVINPFKVLAAADLTVLPDDTAQQLTQKAGEAIDLFGQVAAFNLTAGGDARGQHESLISRFKSSFGHDFYITAGVTALLVGQTEEGIAAAQRRIDSIVEQTEIAARSVEQDREKAERAR